MSSLVRQRQPGYRNKALTDLCRQATGCYLQYDGCLGTPTAACHSNSLRHGRGYAYKSHDYYTIPACLACGSEHDHGKHYSREEKENRWMRAWELWILECFFNNWITVK